MCQKIRLQTALNAHHFLLELSQYQLGTGFLIWSFPTREGGALKYCPQSVEARKGAVKPNQVGFCDGGG